MNFLSFSEQSCIPWYGRNIQGSIFNDHRLSGTASVPTWEDCGIKCHENEQCCLGPGMCLTTDVLLLLAAKNAGFLVNQQPYRTQQQMLIG